MKMRGKARVLIVAIVIALGAFSHGQEASVPSLQELRGRLEDMGAEPGEGKAAARDAYEKAVAALERADEAHGRAAAFRAEADEAPGLIASLREELAVPPAEFDPAGKQLADLEALEATLVEAQAEFALAREGAAELDGLVELRARRKTELPGEIVTAQQAVKAAEQSLASQPAGPENEARRVLAQAELEEARAKLELLEAERDAYEARRELLPLRRDRALRRLARAEKAMAFWSEQVDIRRAAEGEATAKRAEQESADIASRFPLLRKLASDVQDLAAQRSGEEGLPKRISRAQAALEETRARLDEVRRRFRSARLRISAGGLTEGMGLILRRDYEWLPEAGDLRAQSKAREDDLSEAQLELIAFEEQRSAVGDLATAADRWLTEQELTSPPEELRSAVGDLLARQRTIHNDVVGDLERLSSIFYEHEELTSKLLAESSAYRAFIEERILWVRSCPPSPIRSLLAVPAEASEALGAFLGELTLENTKERFDEHRAGLFALVLVLVALVALRGILKRKRREMGERVRSFRTDKYIYTTRALVQTFLLALPLPLATWTLGWILSDSPEELLRAAGKGSREIAAVWFFLRFLRELAVDKGVGAAHFRWPAAGVRTLRKEIRWFEPLGVALGLLALTLDRQPSTEWADSVGRLSFVGAMLALALLAHRLLRAESPLWGNSPQVGKGLLGKTHAVWSLAASGMPLVLAVLALAGYYYTALQFELRLRYSILFAVALVLVNALLLRWLFMTRRSLAVRQALEAKARKEQEEEGEAATESGAAVLDADKVDIPAIDAQTRQLFQRSIILATVIGLFFIWASVLPALRGLDRVQLLPELALVSTEAELTAPPSVAASPSGESPTSTPAAPNMPSPVATPNGASQAGGDTNGLGLPSRLTLADVLLALIFAVLTSLAAKNLPALLELAVLQRLPLDGGSRYAVATIVRYLILIIGVTAISGAVGIGWQKVQWLAAALTFGLAFGLQEIFANFVSGLIILLERPVRVGDIVTVGSTEGRVTQLRMRATTILDWDRREYLVPNKEFITGSVINWTLSDPVTRVVIPVGIAYGSDTALARRLLLEVATNNPLVLADPAPTALFRAFGASSLDFELRVFIVNRDLWPEVIDKLHSQIDQAFREAEIEIAFPQLDLHVVSADGLKEVSGPKGSSS